MIFWFILRCFGLILKGDFRSIFSMLVDWIKVLKIRFVEMILNELAYKKFLTSEFGGFEWYWVCYVRLLKFFRRRRRHLYWFKINEELGTYVYGIRGFVIYLYLRLLVLGWVLKKINSWILYRHPLPFWLRVKIFFFKVNRGIWDFFRTIEISIRRKTFRVKKVIRSKFYKYYNKLAFFLNGLPRFLVVVVSVWIVMIRFIFYGLYILGLVVFNIIWMGLLFLFLVCQMLFYYFKALGGYLIIRVRWWLKI